jgi:ArsR family transcriptional regulator
MNDIDNLLSMVENPTRRRILEYLVKEPSYPLQLSKELGISQQAVMKNLSILEKNGIVDSYQVSSSMGPARTVYEPTTEFTIMIDMRTGMFSARIMQPDDRSEAAEPPVEKTENLEEMRKRIVEIDSRIEELDRERSKAIRERENIIASSVSRLDNTPCGLAHRNLMYEMLNEPETTAKQMAAELGIGTETIESLLGDIEYILKDQKGGKDDEQQQ